MPELSKKVEVIVVAFLFLVMGLAFGDTVVSTVQGVNTTGWSYTGHEAVESMINFTPLIYYGSIILGFMGIIWYSLTRD